MSEVLHVPDAITAVRALRAPDAILDPAMAAVVEAAVAEAEARGRLEGEIAGRQAAVDEVARVISTVGGAIERLHQELVDQRELATRASLELASRVATAVLDRTPPEDALAVLDLVDRAVALLDEDPIQVRLNPADHAVLVSATTDRRLDLIVDPTVARGEALVGTAVAGAELSRRALLDAALTALGEGAA